MHSEVVAVLTPLVESHELPKDFEFAGVVFERKNREVRSLLEQELRNLTSDQCQFLEAGLSQPLSSSSLSYGERTPDIALTSGLG